MINDNNIMPNHVKFCGFIENSKAVLCIEKSKNVLDGLSYWNIHFNLIIDH